MSVNDPMAAGEPAPPAERPKRVVLLPRDEYNRARSKAPELLVDPFVTVVPVPPRASDNLDPAILALGNTFQPSTVLIRNPWGAKTGEYVEAALAYEKISVAKFNTFANVCQLLGAIRLEVKELRQVAENGETTATIGFKSTAVQAKASGGSQWTKQTAQSIKGRWDWQVGQGDPDAAAEYALEHGIADDPVVDSLIQQGRWLRNPLAEYELELDISSEVQRELRGALKVESVLRKLGPSFDLTFERLRGQSDRLWLKVAVSFAKSR